MKSSFADRLSQTAGHRKEYQNFHSNRPTNSRIVQK